MASRRSQIPLMGGDDAFQDVNQFAGMMANTEPLINEYQQASSYRNYAQQIQQGGIESIDMNSIRNMNDAAALGKAMKDYHSTREARAAAFEASNKDNQALYANVVYPTITLMQKHYNSGNFQQFDAMAEQLSSMMPAPMRIRNRGDGNFEVWFRSNDAGGGHVQTPQVLSRDQIFKMAQNLAAGTEWAPAGLNGVMTPQNRDFQRWAWAHQMASKSTNDNELANTLTFKRPLVDAKGNVVAYGTPINKNRKPTDFNAATDWIVYGLNGERIGQGAFTLDNLVKWGVYPGKKQGTKTGAGGPQKLSKDDYKYIDDITSTTDAAGNKVPNPVAAAALSKICAIGGMEPRQAAAFVQELADEQMKKPDNKLKPEEAMQYALKLGQQLVTDKAKGKLGKNANVAKGSTDESTTDQNKTDTKNDRISNALNAGSAKEQTPPQKKRSTTPLTEEELKDYNTVGGETKRMLKGLNDWSEQEGGFWKSLFWPRTSKSTNTY